MKPFDSYFSVEQLCDKVLLTMMPFDLSLSVEQLCDKVLLMMMTFDLSSSVEQTCEYVAVISVITGQLCELRASSLIIKSASYLDR